ncbi:MAG: hypothetical protein NZ742_07305 [Acidobacteria bacterium]|nr:hypothetical protein [Acidobacteriota bacterium]MDW7984635.1 hypothetical protein [Acidobacteriota bacterium]
MLKCPACHRAIVSVNFTKCLYCGATFSEELLQQFRPPDLKAIDHMLLLRQWAERDAVARSYTWARWIYGTGALVWLGLTLGTMYYILRHGVGGLYLAIALATTTLVLAVFFAYKAIRPRPMSGHRTSAFRWRD